MVVAPGRPTDPAQFIDARDLAEWMVRMAENRAFGTYNATGPAAPFTIGELLYGIKSETTAGAQFTWLPAEFLAEQRVRGWSNLPVWLNPAGPTAGFMKRNTSRALAKGLAFRPLAVTARDTLAWHQTRTAEEKKRLDDGTRVGLSAAREAELLKLWMERQPK